MTPHFDYFFPLGVLMFLQRNGGISLKISRGVGLKSDEFTVYLDSGMHCEVKEKQ